MNDFKVIKASDLKDNPFTLFDKDWTLITAEKEGKANTMTASWGTIGRLWNKDVAFCFIRQSRYTKEFVDGSDTFSLSFFNHKLYAKKLGYLGTISGRDEDKIANAGLTVLHDGKTPYFAQARLVLICQKAAKVPLTEDTFIDPDIKKDWYSQEDENNYHDIYIGRILKVLVK